jgi:hypothetical protein
VIAVEIVAAEAGVPVLAGDELAVRHVERLALEVEIPVAGRAGRGRHRDAHTGVLAMTGHAGVRAERCACLGEPRLEEAMHRMGILLAGMAVRALRVADALMAERGIVGTPAEPELHLGLQLLARRAGRLFVTVRAFQGGMPGIGRTLGMEARGVRHHDCRQRRRCQRGTQRIGGELERTLGLESRIGVGGDLCHVSTTAP